tara:strand:+ start:3306 stop:4199 length:894 start_codon:yes stop_codon:yes gene_type:complete
MNYHRKFIEYLLGILKQLKHKFYIFRWLYKKPNKDLDFLGHALLSIASRWEGEVEPVLTYISLFDVLRQNKFKGNFLELGGGYSTILLPVLFENAINLKSIDLYPAKYKRILNSSKNAKLFLSKLKIINKPTVTYKESIEGLEKIINYLSEIDERQLRENLSYFVTDKEILNDIYQSIKENNFLKKYIFEHPNFKSDYDFYLKNNILEGEGFCSKEAKEDINYDAIFFDCGEISSVAEWLLLKDKIKKSGYAIFHDIFYPKSIKNFLVTTYIFNLNDWKVLYFDKVSPQGGLVAQRI